jgi:hypothetical protein
VIREDFLLRQIKLFVDAVARMLKLRKAGKHDEALAIADELYEQLGIPRGLHAVVDTPTLASMLRTADAIRTAAALQLEEGHIYKAKNDPIMASKKYKTAHELMLEARVLEPNEFDDAMLFELSRLAPWYTLDPRYRVDAP